MLTALEQGVIGGKWFSLMDKVYALPNLRQAFARVKANDGAPGVDQVTVEEFEHHLEANLENLSRTLQDGSYRPQAIRREWIDKPGSPEKRPLGILCPTYISTRSTSSWWGRAWRWCGTRTTSCSCAKVRRKPVRPWSRG